MKTVALYARISTELRRGRQDPEVQLDALRAHCRRQGWTGPVAEYTDDVSTREPIKRRPGLSRLLEDCRRGRIDTVVISRLDRIARSTRELIELSDYFVGIRVDLVVVDQAIDTTTPVGKFYFHVLAAVAELEREMIRERVLAGIAHARRRGIRIGAEPRHGLDEAEVLRLFREEGLSRSAIARRLTRPGRARIFPTTISRILARQGLPRTADGPPGPRLGYPLPSPSGSDLTNPPRLTPRFSQLS